MCDVSLHLCDDRRSGLNRLIRRSTRRHVTCAYKNIKIVLNDKSQGELICIYMHKSEIVFSSKGSYISLITRAHLCTHTREHAHTHTCIHMRKHLRDATWRHTFSFAPCQLPHQHAIKIIFFINLIQNKSN